MNDAPERRRHRLHGNRKDVPRLCSRAAGVSQGVPASPVYDAQDRLTSYGDCTYGYKADGSLQTKTCPDGTTSYDYDSFGNLRHVAVRGRASMTCPT
jgi:YD repeat-containing protein